jgi:pimeloyl-ACP methyl ester carboxylesterase
VADELRARGHPVYAPSLTGLADRAHLSVPSIRLQHHIADVVKLVEWEDLDDFVLCGHSYGGMVITGVAEALAQRLRAIVYLDAFLPAPNQSLLDLLGPDAGPALRSAAASDAKGMAPPIPAQMLMVNEQDQAWVDAKCTPHPFTTFEDTLAHVARHEEVARKFYVLASAYQAPVFASLANQRRGRPDWQVFDLPYGHDLMIDAPAEVSRILMQAAA